MILRASFEDKVWVKVTAVPYEFLVVAWNEPRCDYTAFRWTSRSDLAALYCRRARRYYTDSVIVPARAYEPPRGIVEGA